ncbi:MAG: hypothetical protein RQM90_11815 [Methanoculleus sp.]
MIWQFGTNDQVLAVALSEDGLFGATVTGEKVYLFDENGTKLWSYPVSCGRSVAISSGGEHIAAGGDHLLLFDRSGEVLRRYMPASRVQGIAIAADGQAIYAGTGAGLQVFFPESDQTAASAAWSSGTKDPIRSVSIDKEGSGVVAAGESGNIYFFSGEGQLLWNYKTGSNGIRAVISHDGLAVAAVSSQRTITSSTDMGGCSGNLRWTAELWISHSPEMDRLLCWRVRVSPCSVGMERPCGRVCPEKRSGVSPHRLT